MTEKLEEFLRNNPDCEKEIQELVDRAYKDGIQKAKFIFIEELKHIESKIKEIEWTYRNRG